MLPVLPLDNSYSVKNKFLPNLDYKREDYQRYGLIMMEQWIQYTIDDRYWKIE